MNGPITTEETYHVSNILRHYAHTKEKHPYFCDWIQPGTYDTENIEQVKNNLVFARDRIDDGVLTHKLGWDDLLNCEVWEVFDALVRGNTAHAIEELYDCVAVLLRTIDVLEGRQKLGKPEKNNPPPRSARQRKIKKTHFPYCQPK